MSLGELDLEIQLVASSKFCRRVHKFLDEITGTPPADGRAALTILIAAGLASVDRMISAGTVNMPDDRSSDTSALGDHIKAGDVASDEEEEVDTDDISAAASLFHMKEACVREASGSGAAQRSVDGRAGMVEDERGFDLTISSFAGTKAFQTADSGCGRPGAALPTGGGASPAHNCAAGRELIASGWIGRRLTGGGAAASGLSGSDPMS